LAGAYAPRMIRALSSPALRNIAVLVLAAGVWLSPWVASVTQRSPTRIPLKVGTKPVGLFTAAQAASMTAYAAEGVTVDDTAGGKTLSTLYAAVNGGSAPGVNGCVSIEVPSDAAATVFVSGSGQTPVASTAAGSHSAPILAGESRPLPVPMAKVKLISTTSVVVYLHMGNGC
jgi:hypothetical protein